MLSLRLMQYGLWIMAPLLASVLALVMVRRKLYSAFPTFFAYVVTSALSATLTFVLYHTSYKAYFNAYWAGAAISAVLGFALLRELFRHVFRHYQALQKFAFRLFAWSAMVLALIVAASVAIRPESGLTLLVTEILTVQRGVRVIQCGLILLLIIFRKHLALSLRDRAYGIALGFGAYALFELVLSTMALKIGIASSANMALLKSAVYDGCILVWIGYMASKHLDSSPSAIRMPDSEQWDFELAKVTCPELQEHSLKRLDDIVRRALERGQVPA